MVGGGYFRAIPLASAARTAQAGAFVATCCWDSATLRFETAQLAPPLIWSGSMTSPPAL